MKGFEPLGGVAIAKHFLYILTNNKHKSCTAMHIKWWKAYNIDKESEKYDGVFIVSKKSDIDYDDWHRNRISIWFDPTTTKEDSHWNNPNHIQWLQNIQDKYNPNIDIQRFYDKEELPNTLKQMMNEL